MSLHLTGLADSLGILSIRYLMVITKITSNQLHVAKIPDQAELISRAHALLPILKERARQAEQNRRLSEETVAEFRAAGFHKILQPRAYGGFGLGFDTAAEVIRTLATACGSSGWVANLFIVHNWQMGLFPIEA